MTTLAERYATDLFGGPDDLVRESLVKGPPITLFCVWLSSYRVDSDLLFRPCLTGLISAR